MKIVGKGSPCACSLFTPTQPHENGYWAWSTILPRDKDPPHPVPSSSPSLFLKHVSHRAQSHCRVGMGYTQASEREPFGHWRTPPAIEADLVLSLFHVSKSLFHPVLDCIVFFLATLIARCSG